VKARPGNGDPRQATAVAAAVLLSLLPQLAHACAVCGGGNPANRFAFFASTISLSVIPLGLFAVGFLWLRKRIFSQTRDEFRERDADRSGRPKPTKDS